MGLAGAPDLHNRTFFTSREISLNTPEQSFLPLVLPSPKFVAFDELQGFIFHLTLEGIRFLKPRLMLSLVMLPAQPN